VAQRLQLLLGRLLAQGLGLGLQGSACGVPGSPVGPGGPGVVEEVPCRVTEDEELPRGCHR